MRYPDYIKSLNDDALAAYAERAETTPGYIRVHLASVPPRKTPRKPLLERLCAATLGAVSMDEMLAHFYGVPLTQIEDRRRDPTGAGALPSVGRQTAVTEETADAVAPVGGKAA